MSETDTQPTPTPIEVPQTDPAKQSDPGKKITLTGHLLNLYRQWQDSHGKQKPPIVLDANDNPVWLNRRARRLEAALERRYAKGRPCSKPWGKRERRKAKRAAVEAATKALEQAQANLAKSQRI